MNALVSSIVLLAFAALIFAVAFQRLALAFKTLAEGRAIFRRVAISKTLETRLLEKRPIVLDGQRDAEDASHNAPDGEIGSPVDTPLTRPLPPQAGGEEK